MTERLRFPILSDERGALIPIELSSVPFAVRRLFFVTGPVGGATRGGHTTPCIELLCLARGTATVSVGDSAETVGSPLSLNEPGESILVSAGTFVSYTLTDEHSSLLVLADQPYSGKSRS